MGTTVVIATHNQSIIWRFSHPIMRLHEGGLVDIVQSAAE